MVNLELASYLDILVIYPSVDRNLLPEEFNMAIMYLATLNMSQVPRKHQKRIKKPNLSYNQIMEILKKKSNKRFADMDVPSEMGLVNLQTGYKMFVYVKHTQEHMMTDTLIAGKPNFNYTELCKLLSQAVSVMNDSMHLILKPKKLGWHDNVDVHPEMKLFNLKNVPMLYETVYSVMSRNYDGNYKNDPKVHQLELTVLFFIFLCKGEDAKKLATWPGMSTWPCTS